MHTKVLGIILAGGLGKRLFPLTEHRAKPSVPFGAKYRIIDFVLSNFINSEIYSIYVLIQFKCQSLMEHLRDGWMWPGVVRGSFITPVPPQMQAGQNWYRGTADAVYQNLHLIERMAPEIVAVFNADHIYHMDIGQMVAFHRQKKADVTVAAISMPVGESYPFGVLQVDHDWRVTGHEEKPKKALPMPGQPEKALVSMGNYLFDARLLCDTLKRRIEGDRYDLAGDVIPALAQQRRVFAYDFHSNIIPGAQEGEQAAYWRDIGTIKSYYKASMELVLPKPPFDLYNSEWPLRTATYATSPLKLIHDKDGREAVVRDCLLAGGTVIQGGEVGNSIIGRNVFIGSQCLVESSIILDNVSLTEGVKVRRSIIDKHVVLSPGTCIGYDAAEDSSRYFLDPSGIVVVSP